MPENDIKLTCAECGYSASYINNKEAWMDGWNFLDGGLYTCQKCQGSYLTVLMAKYGSLSVEVNNYVEKRKKKLTSL